MSYKTIYSLCILFCLYACADDRFFNPEPVVSPPAEETISGRYLSLVIPPLSGLREKTSSTRADGSASVIRTSFSGMDVELSGEPVADTRGPTENRDQHLEPGDVNKITSLCIFQFNGTGDDAYCFNYKYIAANSATGKIDLSTFAFARPPAGTFTMRVVVIANLPGSRFDSSIWNAPGDVENKRYKTLKNQYITHTAGVVDHYPFFSAGGPNVEGRPVMFGVTDIQYEADKQVTVVLLRNFARVNYNIKVVGTKLNSDYDTWTARLTNLPARSYFLPQGRGATFPHPSSLIKDGYYSEDLAFFVNSGTTGQHTYSDSQYVPVNMHSDVPSATARNRSTFAPLGATCLQVVGMKMSDNGLYVLNQVIYNIYLGANGTTNYSISPNCQYTYNIEIKGESTDDETVVKFVPGYWGGELKAYTFNGGQYNPAGGYPTISAAEANDPIAVNAKDAVKWKYEYKIEVYLQDIQKIGSNPGEGYQMAWGPAGNSYNATSITDGLGNHTKIFNNSIAGFHAFYSIAQLNQSFTIGENSWYLPSISQLMGTYLVTASLYNTLSDSYWSSTATEHTGNNAFYLTKGGEMGEKPKTDGTSCSVRAARDLK